MQIPLALVLMNALALVIIIGGVWYLLSGPGAARRSWKALAERTGLSYRQASQSSLPTLQGELGAVPVSATMGAAAPGRTVGTQVAASFDRSSLPPRFALEHLAWPPLWLIRIPGGALWPAEVPRARAAERAAGFGYFVTCGDPQAARALVSHPQVLQALRRARRAPGRLSIDGERGKVELRTTSMILSPARLDAALSAVTDLARALGDASAELLKEAPHEPVRVLWVSHEMRNRVVLGLVVGFGLFVLPLLAQVQGLPSAVIWGVGGAALVLILLAFVALGRDGEIRLDAEALTYRNGRERKRLSMPLRATLAPGARIDAVQLQLSDGAEQLTLESWTAEHLPRPSGGTRNPVDQQFPPSMLRGLCERLRLQGAL